MEKQQLQEILGYRNEDVLHRFTSLVDVSEEEADDIFAETKKFLWLSQQPGIFITDELLIVDEMWHNFILFTREYAAFCTKYFGRFVHHQPASKAEKLAYKANVQSDPAQARADFNQKLETFISATYDHLGDDTVIKWFSTYPALYSPQRIKELRKA